MSTAPFTGSSAGALRGARPGSFEALGLLVAGRTPKARQTRRERGFRKQLRIQNEENSSCNRASGRLCPASESVMFPARLIGWCGYRADLQCVWILIHEKMGELRADRPINVEVRAEPWRRGAANKLAPTRSSFPWQKRGALIARTNCRRSWRRYDALCHSCRPCLHAIATHISITRRDTLQATALPRSASNSGDSELDCVDAELSIHGDVYSTSSHKVRA